MDSEVSEFLKRKEEVILTIACEHPDKALLYGRPLTELHEQFPDEVKRLPDSSYTVRIEV